MLLLAINSVFSQEGLPKDSANSIVNDSIIVFKDSIVVTDSLKVVPVDTNSIKSPIDYSARDSMMFSVKSKKIYAYGEATLASEKMKLEAGHIVMDMDSSLIYAEPIIDEEGNKQGVPIFTQGSEKYEIDHLIFNPNTKKGVVKGVITEQSGGYLHGGTTKMHDNKEIHLIDGKFTTCDDEHPHFYLYLKKAKIVPEEKIVTSGFYFVLSDIKLKFVGLPWGYFPSFENRTSGIIIPGYGEEKRRGFYLKGGGYYWAFSKNMDLKVTGSKYTNGSWEFNVSSKYKKRYKYGGNIDFKYSEFYQGNKDLEDIGDFSILQTFWVKGSYARDSKANPTTSFNTSLDFGSSKHLRITSINPENFAKNNSSSSIAFTKTFPGTPFNFSANIRANQQLSENMVDLTLPTFAFSMSKQFPFKRKKAVGKKRWYEQISVSFRSKLENKISVADSVLFTEEALEEFENGFDYQVPVSTSLKLFKYFNLSPSFNYHGRLYTKYYEQGLNTDLTTGNVTTYDVALPADGPGLYHVYDYSFSAPISTKIYGIKEFKRGRIAAIRHVLSPSVGYSYKPDFGDPKYGYYKPDILNAEDEFKLYSIYGRSIFGNAPTGESGSITYSVDNNFEMKMHSNDTTEEMKKVVLLNSLRFSGSYNFAADTMQWSDVQISANTKLLKKVNVTYSGLLEVYDINKKTGRKINKTFYESDGSIGRLSRHTVSLSGSLSSDMFKKDKKDKKTKGGNNEIEDPLSENPLSDKTTEKKRIKKEGGGNEDVGYDFKMPWTLSINYNFNYINNWKPSLQKYDPDITQTINLNGNISLTPKWKVTTNASYDFVDKKLVYIRSGITRDLHCWSMMFNFVPFGTYKNYMFRISVNSQMFKGVEYKKQESFIDNFEF